MARNLQTSTSGLGGNVSLSEYLECPWRRHAMRVTQRQLSSRTPSCANSRCRKMNPLRISNTRQPRQESPVPNRMNQTTSLGMSTSFWAIEQCPQRRWQMKEHFHFLLFSFIFYHFRSSSFIFFHLLSFSFIFFHCLSLSIIFFHVLSFSFMFFHFLSRSFMFFHFRSFSFIFVHFLSSSFIFFHLLSFCFRNLPTNTQSC